MNAADVLVKELQARGVPFIATLNGHGLDPLLLACKRAGMRMIDVRNEQAAGYMAEVTGRLTCSSRARRSFAPGSTGTGFFASATVACLARRSLSTLRK